jgi:hypothetical protein
MLGCGVGFQLREPASEEAVASVGRRRPASVGSGRQQEPASEEEVGGVGRRCPASVGGGRRQEAAAVLGCGVGFQGERKD